MTLTERQAEMNIKLNGKLEEMKRELLFTNLGDLNDVVDYENSVKNLLGKYYDNEFDTLQLNILKCDLNFSDFYDLIQDRLFKIRLSYKNSL